MGGKRYKEITKIRDFLWNAHGTTSVDARVGQPLRSLYITDSLKIASIRIHPDHFKRNHSETRLQPKRYFCGPF